MATFPLTFFSSARASARPMPLRVGLMVAFVAVVFSASVALAAGEAPLRALLVTGGCCHNYEFQTLAIKEAVAEHAEVNWTVVNEGGAGSRAQIALYDRPDWAAPYDVVVHNSCFAETADPDYIRRIIAGHLAGKGISAVVIHCAMHTYRDAKIDDWREFLGISSHRHDHQARYPVRVEQPGHPVLKDFPADWVTPRDELYTVDKVWPGVTVLATSASEVNGASHPVIWVNDYRGVRVFGTTYGHSDETFSDPVFRDLLARGLLWAAKRAE